MDAAISRPERVLVIGISPRKNEEVVDGLRNIGIDAVGCTAPNAAAQLYDAHDFSVIAFGRATLGPLAESLKRAFALQDPGVRFIDAFGPIAVAQVRAILQRLPGSFAFIQSPIFTSRDQGGELTADVQAACDITVTIFGQPTEQGLSEVVILDASVAVGQLTVPVADVDLVDAYSLVLAVNNEEYHHLPFL
ncbi:hypothetical protein ACTXKL_18450 [Brachybacterium tyrofermentans]|uniref:hypothetical protein n=1 Tax=Brachybacterium tyrofermentans TaxID=47848 RepID=UPI003FD3E2A2